MTIEDNVLTDTSARTHVEAVTSAVAQRVRALRQARNWSLDELSGRSGVSKGMVVQIEAARTNPSVATLCRIADAFGVTVAQLLEPTADRTVRVSRAADAPLLWRGGYGGFGRILAGVNGPELVELWEWRLSPHDRYEAPDHPVGTRELVHVLSGELTITVDGTEYPVQPGETIDFQADKTHAYRNDGEHAVRLLMVVLLPS